jgi:hypothetical protein
MDLLGFPLEIKRLPIALIIWLLLAVAVVVTQRQVAVVVALADIFLQLIPTFLQALHTP